MSLLTITSILLTVSALFAYANYRTLKLPTTIGIMVISLVFSLVLVLLGMLGYERGVETASNIVSQIEFDATLLNGMLGFLLFAGAMHIDLHGLLKHKWTIGLLASVGVITSTFIVATGAYFLFALFGFNIPYIYCLLFGSLISPTDPIAVMGILKTAGASKSLEIKIAGESLFNDGVAIVVFLAIFGMAVHGEAFDAQNIAILFAQEAFGGALFGFACGYLVLQMLKRVDNYQVEILLTLALVSGGATAAAGLHLSAPIAVVVAGLMIGNHGRRDAMSDTTKQHLDTFWELIDEILNAVLFLLIGLEVMVLSFSVQIWIAGVLMSFRTRLAFDLSGHPDQSFAQTRLRFSSTCSKDTDLGRLARWYLGSTCVIHTGRCGARCHRRRYLCDRGDFDFVTRFDHRQTGQGNGSRSER